MESPLGLFVGKWLYDPTVGKMLATIAGLIAVYAVVKFLQ